MERWQLLGLHSMKHYQDSRYEQAVEKDFIESADVQGEENLETLDVMKSLKNQFANIKQR